MKTEIITSTEREMLISEMESLLEKYDYEYTTSALNKIIDKWASNKADLIAHFKNHPNYVEGKFLIAFETDYERKIDIHTIQSFITWVNQQFSTLVNNRYLPDDVNKVRMEEGSAYLPDRMFCWLVYDLEKINEQFISEAQAENINEVFPFAHAHTGQKASRVVNKILTYLGFNKFPDYNREYAKFADALSPLKIKRHTVLSINPLDYLTMSFGNSWASCHTIDKANIRCMPNAYHGMYSSGTISYMLDGTSMVLYTVDSAYNGTDYWTQPKINRQMFHWGEEKLVQGRLYPQDNDGDSSAYTPFREIVQSIISNIYDFPNLWTVTKGTNSASKYVYSLGTHYRDYSYYDNCTLSRIKGSENENCFDVGHAPICIECGEEHDIAESINCCRVGTKCAGCGCLIEDEDYVNWVNGEPYCDDCVTWCEECQECHLREDCTWIDSESRYVCNDCLDRYYVVCEDCGEYVYRDDAYDTEDGYICMDCRDNDYHYCEDTQCYVHYNNCTYIDSENIYVSDDYRDDHYVICDKCLEWFKKDEVEYDENGNKYCPDCYADLFLESEAM